MKMTDCIKKLDAFLQFNEYQVLKDAGKVSHAVAMKLAETAYEKFRIEQDRTSKSDFERLLKQNKDE